MEQIYFVMIIVLGLLAIFDLVVGVSNDAVNFLNSAIGSKAIDFKTTMIVASIGVFVGSLFSSGMMEIARDGIFNPSMFSFDDVMIIFLAVMLTDVLLLDVFNSFGLPTSTTVSIIFELLGASVCLALFKIYQSDASFSTLTNYINTEKASQIVVSILLSVGLSFILGSLVQYISRLIFSFHYEKNLKIIGSLFGGLSMTAIVYFILIKGLKGTALVSKEQTIWINDHQWIVIGILLLALTVLSQILISAFKWHILKVIIVLGTFSLALAFAGNDLVNFIGVPIAAFQAYGFFKSANSSGDTYLMHELANDEIVAPFYFLLIAGFVMVITLWFSKKARAVIETGVNLSRQDEGVEKFKPNTLSKAIVRISVGVGQALDTVIPKSWQAKIDSRFVKPKRRRKNDEPAFDMIRASINLVVASVLIALGTSLKLPLSTTYVTFMVAMGSSFADRAWDRESAVFRIAGVFNVIGGWFFTAFVAFTGAFILAFFLKIGKLIAFIAILILIGILLYKNTMRFSKKSKFEDDLSQLKREDITTIQQVINESSTQIANIVAKSNELYTHCIENLALQNLSELKKIKKDVSIIEKQIDELKNNVYYFIQNLEESSVEASKFYVLNLGYLQDLVQSMDFIASKSFTHIDNNHKQLKFNQIRDLKNIDIALSEYLKAIETLFKNQDFKTLEIAYDLKDKSSLMVSELLQKQIIRIRTSETSPKNSKLYFGILLEINDVIKTTSNLLDIYKEFQDVYLKNK
jgi:phosphate/sulfate permease